MQATVEELSLEVVLECTACWDRSTEIKKKFKHWEVQGKALD